MGNKGGSESAPGSEHSSDGRRSRAGMDASCHSRKSEKTQFGEIFERNRRESLDEQATSSSRKSVSKSKSGRMGALQLTGRYHLLPKRLTDDYIVLTDRPLGSGFNGVVHQAVSKTNRENKFAVKAFNLSHLSAQKKGQLESEIEIFLRMDHPHVARLHNVYEAEERLDLVMECMEGGELFDRVTEVKRFNERDAADAVWQMLLALNYIHSHSIVHRDLKLENFLYEQKGGRHLKLIDFGFSKLWENTSVKMQLSCGTLSYVAPEVLRKDYTSQCDLWSLGVLAFIILSGYMPFHGDEKKQTQNILQGRFVMKPEKWDPISADAKDFTKKLLQVDPKARLTAAAALKHSWIVNREQMGAVDIDLSVVEALRNYRLSSRFRRSCMEMMAWSLSTEDRAKVREYFIRMDTAKNGTISLQELRTVLTSHFEIDDAETREIFDALDSSGDEEIHYSDFLAAMVSTRINLHDDLLRSAFKKFDRDNSGYITVRNLKEVLGESMPEEDITQLLEEADQLQDGKISYAEFVAYLKGAPMEHHKEAASMIIDHQVEVSPPERKRDRIRAVLRRKDSGSREGATGRASRRDRCVLL